MKEVCFIVRGNTMVVRDSDTGEVEDVLVLLPDDAEMLQEFQQEKRKVIDESVTD